MNCAIIVGFSYKNSENEEVLQSSRYDIAKIYSYCCGKCEEIYVVTDITDLDVPSYVISNLKQLIKILKRIKLRHQTLIYYTGHGTPTGIKLPSDELLPYIEYRDLFLSMFVERAEILWILDCCYSGQFPLPYNLNNNVFRMINMNYATIHDIICFVSGSHNDKSISNEKYSYYTKYLSETLFDEETYSLILIDQYTKKKLALRTTQTPIIKSSCKIIPVVWPWVYNSTIRIRAESEGLRIYGLYK